MTTTDGGWDPYLAHQIIDDMREKNKDIDGPKPEDESEDSDESE